jgi:hypothetical protein
MHKPFDFPSHSSSGKSITQSGLKISRGEGQPVAHFVADHPVPSGLGSYPGQQKDQVT